MTTKVITADAVWPPGAPHPVITGAGTVGSTLTCFAPDAVSFQWLRDGAAIPGATSSTYVVAQADGGHILTCRVGDDSNTITVAPSNTGPFDAWARKATLSLSGPVAPQSGSFRIDVDLTSHVDSLASAQVNLDDIRVADQNDNLIPIEVRSEGGQQISADGAWSFFNNPHAVYQRVGSTNWLHVGSVTRDGSPSVTSFNIDSGQILQTNLHSQLQADDHNPVGLLVMPDGTLFASYSKHGVADSTGMKWRRTTDPANPASWGPENTTTLNFAPANGGSGWTYPRPVKFASGRMFLFFRAANLDMSCIYSEDDGGVWQGPFSIISSGNTPYNNITYNAELDLVDVTFVDQHPRVFDNSVWHITIDSSGNVRKTDGTLIRNVLTGGHITPTEASRVYQYTTAQGSGWSWDVCRDPADSSQIFVVFARFANDVLGVPSTYHDHRYSWGRWDGSAWSWHEFASAGESLFGPQEVTETQYSGGLHLSKVNPRVVYCARQVPGTTRWRLHRYETADNGLTFTSKEVTPGSLVKNARPVGPLHPEVLVGAAAAEMVFMSGSYTSYTNYNMRILSHPPRPGVQIPRSISVLVPDLGGISRDFTVYYGNPGAPSVATDLDGFAPVTTPGIYALSAGGAN